MKRSILLIFAFLLMLTMLFGCSHSTVDIITAEPFDDTGAALIVHYIDVGQGNSVLLESDGHFVLIDAGEKQYGNKVCDYISSRGAEVIDYVIATHPHSDHIGGMQEVIEQFDCINFITAETDQSTKQWINLLDAVDKNDVRFIDPVVGATYSFGEAQFNILAPNSDQYDGYNNYSVVLRATCGDNSFLFMGDAETQSENEILAAGAEVSSDVIMLGHHGSSSSSSKSFISAVDPSYAIISCSADNEYGHPHSKTLKTLNSLSIKYLMTSECGNIIAACDKSTIKLYYGTNTDTADIIGAASSTAKASPTDNLDKKISQAYIGNLSSKKFHRANCESVADMSDTNKIYFDSRQKAIDNGYVPCKHCNP